MRTGLAHLPQVLMNGQPLKQEELAQENFEEAVVGSIMKATPDIQRAVYNVSEMIRIRISRMRMLITEEISSNLII